MTRLSDLSEQLVEVSSCRHAREENPRLDRQAGPGWPRPRRQDYCARAARRGHGSHLHWPAADAGDDRFGGRAGRRGRDRAFDSFGSAQHALPAADGPAACQGHGRRDRARGRDHSGSGYSRAEEAGIAGIFLPGASTQEIVEFVRAHAPGATNGLEAHCAARRRVRYTETFRSRFAAAPRFGNQEDRALPNNVLATRVQPKSGDFEARTRRMVDLLGEIKNEEAKSKRAAARRPSRRSTRRGA